MYAVIINGFAIGYALYTNVCTQTQPQQRHAFQVAQVMPAAPARMVGVGMGNHSTGYGLPRIYIKITGRAVNTFVCELENGEHAIGL